jgi:hypothetical protein
MVVYERTANLSNRRASRRAPQLFGGRAFARSPWKVCAQRTIRSLKMKFSGGKPGGASRASVEAANFAALDFLERSRDVANEVVVDGAHAETSSLPYEQNRDPGSGSDV